MMFQPSRDEFLEYAKRGNLVPVFRELPADLETPVSVYLKLRGNDNSFLLESVEGGEQIARYSFIGVNPARVISLQQGDSLDAVRDALKNYRAVSVPGLPRFTGGAVGFLTYDIVNQLERIRAHHNGNFQEYPLRDLPEALFLLADTLIAFDHVKHRMLVIANAHVNGDVYKAYDDATARINQLIARLRQPLYPPTRGSVANGFRLTSNMSPERYCDMVCAAQEHIAAGDIFQVVLSQRFERETHAEAFEIYRALRRLILFGFRRNPIRRRVARNVGAFGRRRRAVKSDCGHATTRRVGTGRCGISKRIALGPERTRRTCDAR